MGNDRQLDKIGEEGRMMQGVVDMMLQMASELKDIRATVESLRKTRMERFREVWMMGQEVEELLGISTRTLQNMRDRGEIPCSRIGHKFYYKLTDIEAVLESGYKR